MRPVHIAHGDGFFALGGDPVEQDSGAGADLVDADQLEGLDGVAGPVVADGHGASHCLGADGRVVVVEVCEVEHSGEADGRAVAFDEPFGHVLISAAGCAHCFAFLRP